MVNITIDIAGVIDKIKEIVVAIADVRKAEKERRAKAHDLVYYTLSIHPALDFMRPPTGAFADMDWYSEMRSSWKSGILRGIGNFELYSLSMSAELTLLESSFRTKSALQAYGFAGRGWYKSEDNAPSAVDHRPSLRRRPDLQAVIYSH